MENLYGMIPLTLFTIFGLIYHIGHVEYEKDKKSNDV